MDAATGTGSTLSIFLPETSPVRICLARLAEECATLTTQLDRELEPLHRLGEELLARIASTRGSAHMA